MIMVAVNDHSHRWRCLESMQVWLPLCDGTVSVGMLMGRLKTGIVFLATGIVFANVVNLDYNWRHLPSLGVNLGSAESWSLTKYQYVWTYAKSPIGLALIFVTLGLFMVAAVMLWLGSRPPSESQPNQDGGNPTGRRRRSRRRGSPSGAA